MMCAPVPTPSYRLVTFLCALLLVITGSGCITTTMIAQPSFWDTCGEKENCGPVVAGVLGGEVLLYGIAAGVAAATVKAKEPDHGSPARDEADEASDEEPTVDRSHVERER